MSRHILLTGATGMLGKELIGTLLKRGYQVSVLSRKPQNINQVKVFLWNVDQQKIDTSCLISVDSIIHLAGENIAKERWSEKRKKEIIDSRILSARLLFETISSQANQVKTFISAAAVGIYGDRGDEILKENSPAGHGFLAECCQKWEDAIDQGENLGLRIVKLRTGVVLGKADGALPEMSKPIRLFAGAPLGSGRQRIPWVHHQDMIQIYVHALENSSLTGTYNACAPFPVTNKTLIRAIARQLHRPVWPFNVPAKVINLILGEMSEIVLNSTNTSAQKLLNAGFIFKYTGLEDALSDIYSQ